MFGHVHDNCCWEVGPICMVIPAPCNHFSQTIFWKSMMQPFRVKLWKENQLWAKATHVNKLWCQAGKTSHVIYIQANDPFNGITITNSSTVKFPEGTWNPRMFGRSHTQRGHLNTPLGIAIAANNSEGSQKFGIYSPPQSSHLEHPSLPARGSKYRTIRPLSQPLPTSLFCSPAESQDNIATQVRCHTSLRTQSSEGFCGACALSTPPPDTRLLSCPSPHINA